MKKDQQKELKPLPNNKNKAIFDKDFNIVVEEEVFFLGKKKKRLKKLKW